MYDDDYNGVMIDVLQAAEDFLVCYKNENLDFHNSEEGPGFFSLLKKQYPDETLYPVHRLDKGTSGLILAARSLKAAAGLGKMIGSGDMEKVYITISDKFPRKKQGWVIGDMERSRRGQWMLLRTKINPARSYFISRSVSPGIRLFFFRIYTGKTHQIRVAMKSLGSPVLGDPIYYASSREYERMYLHSWKLKFEWKGCVYDLECLPRSGDLFPDDLNDLAGGFSWPVLP